MRWNEIVNETSTAGATAAGNIATVVGNGGVAQGTIGAGFNAGGHQGIYEKSKTKTKKDKGSSVLKR